MKKHPYQETLEKMSTQEILAEMDEYGDGHYIIHEAAERIRLLLNMVAFAHEHHWP